MKNITRFLLSIGLVPVFVVLCAHADDTEGTHTADTNDSRVMLQQRKELDKTVWADEVEAQVYESVFIRLWDRIRAGDAAEKYTALTDFPLVGELKLPTPGPVETLDMGITLTEFQDAPMRTFTPAEWEMFARSFQEAGIQIIQTEWHHSRFVPASATNAPKSTISFSLHAIREATRTTFAVKGNLTVQWAEANPDGTAADPVAESISVSGLNLQERSDGGLFRELFNIEHGPDDFISAFPVLMYDLDNDGRSEIILPRWNTVWWNKGKRQFEQSPLLEQPIPIWEAGIFSDFNGDGNADFITVGKDGSPYFYAGTELGKFPGEPMACADIHFDMPTAITAGDVDADGDLDLWMTQYKLSFSDGQMPTPYYDANDGPPSYFLINDGSGSFADVTESAGLSPLRNRRSYSSSFIDLDQDGDLDLMNVSDYAGLDIYRNNGQGKFSLDTESFVENRHFFGMGHTLGDYNQDGLLDFYVIGMSSTTARRLDRLDLKREDRPDVHPMRAAMGYGNRLYLGTKDGGFREDPEVAAAVARTGWSWGSTSFDFDLDGDQDIYVANGHRSGKSCQDYCTTFWRHDIYTGTSKEDLEVLKVFQSTLSELNRDELSWNGYEKNVLLVNQPDRPERFINSAFMFGAAYSFDARSVISDDLDGDGRPDLVVAESAWDGRGFALTIHVLANEVTTEQTNNWFSVRLRESPGPGFSPNGAKVAITDDRGKVQTRWIVSGDSFLAQHAPVAHFGLGKANHVTTIEVTWPNGEIERHDNLSLVNRSVIIHGNDLADAKKKTM